MIPVWLTDTVTPDLGRAMHYTQLWGLRGVELRTVGGAEERVPEVNEQQIRTHVSESEMLLASVVPNLFEGPVSAKASWMNDLMRFDDTLQFCTRVGCPRVVIPPFAAQPDTNFAEVADALRQAGEKAAKHDVLIAVVNGPETTCPTGYALSDVLSRVDHPNVKAAWDPASAKRAGEDPLEGLVALEGQVSLVRCSDGRVANGRWEDTDLGEGQIDWPTQLQMLAAQDFLGPISLEVYVEPRPKHGLRSATTLIRWLRQARAEK